MISLSARWCMFRLQFSCWLWDLRGLPRCPYHGFHAQSWWTGYCKECGEIPVIPLMEDMCSFCGEEKAVFQRANPNGDKELWSLCWECDQFIEWSLSHSMHLHMASLGAGMADVEDLPFDEWLFKHHQVWPKHSYTNIVLRRK